MSDLEKRQQKHERNAERAQKEIEAVLKKRKLSLVANYVKETNMVHLELIPVELMQARAVAQAAGEEYKKTLTEQGDAITAKE